MPVPQSMLHHTVSGQPKSSNSKASESELDVAFHVAARIRDISEYYQRASDGLFDEGGKPNEPTSEAVLGSLRLNGVRKLVLESETLGKAALLSVVWNIIESAQKSFRSVTDHFNAKIEEVKAADSRWIEFDAREVKRSSKDSELYRRCMELLNTFDRVPVMRSFKSLESDTKPSLGTDAAGKTSFVYAKLKSPTEAIRLVRMDSMSDSLEASICLKTRIVHLRDSFSYATLSYTWGNPFGVFRSHKNRDTAQRNDIPIICDGHILEIGENLHRFLRRWRQALIVTEKRPKDSDVPEIPEEARLPSELWIDAISINQQDIEEKNSQVSIMGVIYAQSAMTLVWLGEEDEFSREALSIMGKVASEVDEKDIESLVMLESAVMLEKLGLPDNASWKWFAVFAFFQRNWFRRSWIVQEAVLSPRVLLQCGSMLFPWMLLDQGYVVLQRIGLIPIIRGIGMTETQHTRHELRTIQSNTARRTVLKKISLNSTEMRFNPANEGMEPNIGGMVARISRIKTLDPHMASTNMNESSRNGYAPFDRCYEFLELWAFSRKTLCSDPRDKVYAMASLANRDIYMTANTMENRRPLSPDYSKSVSEAYCDMAWFTLLTQADLSVLSMVGYIPDGNKYNLPSWVPDLSYATRMEALNFVLRTRPGLGWLAAGDARWELPPPALLYQRRLSVKAIFVSKIRVIDHAEPSMKDGEPFKFDYKQALEFAENLPSSYYYGGQTQFEVLWRTVIADMAGGDSPAPSRYATEFEKCYLQALREASDDFGVRNAKDFDFLLSLSAMWDLGRLKDDDLSASMEYMHINTNATVEFRNRLMSTMANRRLFIAESGHAGCGDTNLCIGDWVVVLAGSNIPFILRNEGGDGMYRVIGEAYVHGIMYGEAAAKHDVQWKPITLE